MTTIKTKKTGREAGQEARMGAISNLITPPLDGCYRQIGISAVAAAVRYQGVAKNPAYAPTPTNWQELTGDAAG